MIGERSVINGIARATGIVVMSSEVVAIVYDMRWWVMASICLIIVDFWFGVSESKFSGKDIRKSKACRRTMNKVVDYLCYLMIAGVLGMAMEPMGINPLKLATIVMILTSAWELDSIYGHVCVLHGVEKDFSIRKFLVGLFKRKNDAIRDAADEAKERESEL